ncbi:MAG: hypothetical protein ABSB70_20915 [Candidatus Velthaea sp.]
MLRLLGSAYGCAASGGSVCAVPQAKVAFTAEPQVAVAFAAGPQVALALAATPQAGRFGRTEHP